MSIYSVMNMSIYEEIQQERKRQIEKWGVQNHAPIEWCAILGEEVGEVNKAALENYFTKWYEPTSLDNYRKELIQVAAVCVAMIETLDRQENES